MAATPKDSLEKINAVTNAWETLRPDKTFAGMTLAQFKAKVKPSLDARAEIGTLESQLVAAQNKRDDSDAAAITAIQFVVNSVKGDPAEGEDGEFYEALGYVRKSERSSGLHRGKTAEAPKP